MRKGIPARIVRDGKLSPEIPAIPLGKPWEF